MRTPHSVSDAPLLNTVMPGLVPGIHALARGTKNVDGRDKPGHDEPRPARSEASSPRPARTTFADRSTNLSKDADATLRKRRTASQHRHARPCAGYPRTCSRHQERGWAG